MLRHFFKRSHVALQAQWHEDGHHKLVTRFGSSVVGGAVAYSIGLKSEQNTTFLVLLRPIFAPKMKIAPLQRDWRVEVVKDLLLLGPEK